MLSLKALETLRPRDAKHHHVAGTGVNANAIGSSIAASGWTRARPPRMAPSILSK
jgi:hypothetical protein